jgi:hypothetical protein
MAQQPWSIEYDTWCAVIQWNDHPSTTVEDVVIVMKHMLADLEALGL